MTVKHILRRTVTAAAIAGISMLLHVHVAHAQAYPTKPVRLVIPFPAGGATDTVARLVARKMTDTMGVQVLVENRPGANGNIATEHVIRSAPDGYSAIVLATSTAAINPTLFGNLGFDPVRDLLPVAYLFGVPSVILVHPAVQANTLPQLLGLLKEKDHRINFGSQGSGTTSNIAWEQLKRLASVDALHVPFQGDSPMFTALLAGTVQFAIATVTSSAPPVRNKTLRAIAVTGAQRAPSLPGVPTVAESGFPGYNVTTWFGLGVPLGTAPEIVRRLTSEVNNALNQPDVMERLIAIGAVPNTMSAEQFGKFWRDERDRWGQIVRESGAKPD